MGVSNITDIISSYNYTILIFYLYFLFLIGSGYFINYILYVIIDKQICRETKLTKQILHSINGRFEILDNSIIEELNYNKILIELEKIKVN